MLETWQAQNDIKLQTFMFIQSTKTSKFQPILLKLLPIIELV